jgi:hypothetical protein
MSEFFPKMQRDRGVGVGVVGVGVVGVGVGVCEDDQVGVSQ